MEWERHGQEFQSGMPVLKIKARGWRWSAGPILILAWCAAAWGGEAGSALAAPTGDRVEEVVVYGRAQQLVGTA